MMSRLVGSRSLVTLFTRTNVVAVRSLHAATRLESPEEKIPAEKQVKVKVTKVKKTRDPNLPKRPPSGFMIWLNAERPTLKANNPGVKVSEIAKVAGEMWRGMSEVDKQPWNDAYAAAKVPYNEAMEEYKRLYVKAPEPNLAPKRPMTSYMRWLKAERPNIVARHPELTPVEVARKAGEEWRGLADSDKEVWVQAWLKDKKIFDDTAATTNPE
eukprot:m.415262 g.415262  ORF g.415262 m.415262 type:complete len:213 (-) comp29576_c0_seq1:178-816(-)